MIVFPLIVLGIWSGGCEAAVESQKVIVELAIFCDLEFGEYFHHNQQQIKEYWAARIWDANLRFRTLPSVNISFRVTSLTTIKDKAKQSFVEQNRNHERQVSMEAVLRDFAKWVQIQKHSIIPKYDLALLGMGAEVHDDSGSGSLAFVGGACDTHFYDGNTGTMVLYISKEKRWDSCGSLEFGLGTLLNAQRDHKYDNDTGCQDKKFIKSGGCSINHFFFSSCSDKAIANFIREPDSSCLHRNDAPEANVFQAEILAKHPPSLKEQCFQLVNNSKAMVTTQNGEDPCFKTNCYLEINGNRSFYQNLYPIDNSPCDDEKACFRGRCIPNGFQLINVESGLCLHSSDQFASNDSVQLVSCPDVATPLDQFMILDKGKLGLFLATPYSTKDANENSDKCLGFNSNGDSQVFKYEKCSDVENNTNYGWDVYIQNRIEEKYVLFHKNSNSCLASTPKGYLFTTSLSTSWNPFIEWKFVGDDQPPTHLFLEMSSTPTSTTPTTTTTTTGTVKTSTVIKTQPTNVTTPSYGKNNSDISGSEVTTTTENITQQQQQQKLCTHVGHSWGTIVLVGFLVFFGTIATIVSIAKLKTRVQQNYGEDQCILEIHDI